MTSSRSSLVPLALIVCLSFGCGGTADEGAPTGIEPLADTLRMAPGIPRGRLETAEWGVATNSVSFKQASVQGHLVAGFLSSPRDNDGKSFLKIELTESTPQPTSAPQFEVDGSVSRLEGKWMLYAPSPKPDDDEYTPLDGHGPSEFASVVDHDFLALIGSGGTIRLVIDDTTIEIPKSSLQPVRDLASLLKKYQTASREYREHWWAGARSTEPTVE